MFRNHPAQVFIRNYVDIRQRQYSIQQSRNRLRRRVIGGCHVGRVDAACLQSNGKLLSNQIDRRSRQHARLHTNRPGVIDVSKTAPPAWGTNPSRPDMVGFGIM
jgi:hypothetical protein